MTALWVGIAGFFGTIARYVVAGVASRVNETLPWGTFAVNISGSFLLGLMVGVFTHRVPVHPDLRVAITVGFFGAYTTFSTLMLESFEFIETRSTGLAFANIGMSIIAGLLAVWAGLSLGRA
jgi:CrcB protein